MMLIQNWIISPRLDMSCFTVIENSLMENG